MFSRLASSSPTAGSLAWSHSGGNAIVHYSNPEQTYESFNLDGKWITLSGWGNRSAYGDNYYQIYTTKAVVFNNGKMIDLTPQFFGKAHPYAIQNIPTASTSFTWRQP